MRLGDLVWNERLVEYYKLTRREQNDCCIDGNCDSFFRILLSDADYWTSVQMGSALLEYVDQSKILPTYKSEILTNLVSSNE